jgi:uncharacterized protein
LKIVLDTNILISAAARPNNAAGKIIEAWFDHRYTLLTSEFQLDEFRRVSRYARIQQFLPAHRAGAMVNELRSRAIILKPKSIPDVSRDPDDNFILVVAVSGNANYLVSRDRLDILVLQT